MLHIVCQEFHGLGRVPIDRTDDVADHDPLAIDQVTNRQAIQREGLGGRSREVQVDVQIAQPEPFGEGCLSEQAPIVGAPGGPPNAEFRNRKFRAIFRSGVPK